MTTRNRRPRADLIILKCRHYGTYAFQPVSREGSAFMGRYNVTNAYLDTHEAAYLKVTAISEGLRVAGKPVSIPAMKVVAA